MSQENINRTFQQYLTGNLSAPDIVYFLSVVLQDDPNPNNINHWANFLVIRRMPPEDRRQSLISFGYLPQEVDGMGSYEQMAALYFHNP